MYVGFCNKLVPPSPKDHSCFVIALPPPPTDVLLNVVVKGTHPLVLVGEKIGEGFPKTTIVSLHISVPP